MSVFVLWVIILIVFFVVKSKKITDSVQNGKDMHKEMESSQSVFVPKPGKNKPSARPNVERDCRAEDGHHAEYKGAGKTSPVRTTQTRTAVNSTWDKPTPQAAPKMKREGNKMIAARLYEGDRVPAGYRKMVCDYCGAENLVPQFAREDYFCYFCHDKL
ncbi:MAG: hypothetical protein ACI39N_02255 [Lachnospiraceae bacterium]